MEPKREVSRILHDEHMAVMKLLERLDAFLRANAAAPPAVDSPAVATLLGEVASVIEDEVRDHFAFEDEVVFPALDEAGEGDLPAALAEEHTTLLPLGREVAQLARAARADGFDAESWGRFRRLAGALASDLSSHAEKEEIALLSLIDEVIEDDLDRTLAAQHPGRA